MLLDSTIEGETVQKNKKNCHQCKYCIIYFVLKTVQDETLEILQI